MWEVLENGKPCVIPGAVAWATNKFLSFQEAQNYARAWLAGWKSSIPDLWDGSPIDYDGYGDIIEIRKVIKE